MFAVERLRGQWEDTRGRVVARQASLDAMVTGSGTVRQLEGELNSAHAQLNGSLDAAAQGEKGQTTQVFQVVTL